MKTIWIVGVLAALILPVPASALENRLHNHPSPYLALHGSDPVAWQEWNATTVARAKAEGKLLYVSVGYFSCHWCHVMQKESYKNAAIARYLNEHFIPVKVDRELEPALDQQLIGFAEKTRGISGWPLNAFVTPDGYPLYATLYHPPAEFEKVIRRVEQLWRQDRDRLAQLAQVESVAATGPGKPQLDAREVQVRVQSVADAIWQQADRVQGGFGEQSKFPFAPLLMFLLDQQERSPQKDHHDFLELTLEAMARQGMYDHLGDGFFRYTVDPSWKTPHFEKMLYDQAQLSLVYRRAAHVLKRANYRLVADRTLDFMMKELSASGGGFGAALSALDGDGVEGGYYLWNRTQLESLLAPDEVEVYRLYAGMSDAPPFDAGWLPLGSQSAADVAKRLRREAREVDSLITSAKAKLRAAREKRSLPRDLKVIAAWNGLALSALAAAVHDQKEPRYQQAGDSLRRYLGTVMWDGKQLVRSRAGKVAGGAAALEDYAYVSRGLVDWARVTGRAEDWMLAAAIARQAWASFYSQNGWRLQEKSLLAIDRGQDAVPDSHLPSPTAVLIGASLDIADHQRDDALRRQALAAANSGDRLVRESPLWHASLATVQIRATGR